MRRCRQKRVKEHGADTNRRRQEEDKWARRVLIADDEPNIVVSLEFLMKQKGYHVSVVTNGEDALRAVGEFGPDLILLDVMMARLTDTTFARRCARIPRGQHIQDHHAVREGTRRRSEQGDRGWR